MIILFLILLIITPKVFAQELSEIYPAPTTSDFEWIEIFNNTNTQINLEEFYLSDLAGNKILFPKTILEKNKYAIATSSSILNNSGDTIFFKKINSEIIEIATYSGSFTNLKSFAKCNNNWVTTNTITKGYANDLSCINQLSPSPTSTPTPTQIIENDSTYFLYQNIYISEIYPFPNDSEKEWVELFNNNDYEVNLNGWYLDDKENSGASPKKIDLKILAKQYGVFEFNSSILNNNGDSVRLLDYKNNVINDLEYNSSEKAKSLSRNDFSQDILCITNPTKNNSNENCTITPTATLTPKISITIYPTLTKSIKKNILTKKNILNNNYLPPKNNKGEVLSAKTEIIKEKTGTNPFFAFHIISLLNIFYVLHKIIK